MNPFAETPDPPYYAVVFTSTRRSGHEQEYARVADRMLELARQQPGFLGVETSRGADGVGITVSYWRDPASVERWGGHAEHLLAQQKGREAFYSGFRLRLCRVEDLRSMTGD